MSSKLLLALFMIVLMASIITISIPTSSALTTRMEFNDNHYTARYAGGQKICGDHICAPGEYDKMQQALAKGQTVNKTKTSVPPSINTTQVQNMTQAENMTQSQNMTQGQNTIQEQTSSTSVCKPLETILVNAGISSTVIAKVMSDLGCS